MIDILYIVWLHFIGDFVLQSDKIATLKSRDNRYLLLHSVVYSLPMLLIGPEFAITNGVLHYCVDYFTSRGTKKLYANEKRHWFFTLIGFDQAIHLTFLVFTFIYI